jgi:hypothetical protein
MGIVSVCVYAGGVVVSEVNVADGLVLQTLGAGNIILLYFLCILDDDLVGVGDAEGCGSD